MRLLLLLLITTLISCGPTDEPRPDEGTFPGECSDGADNDDDDLFDCDDPDCAGAPDCSGDDDDATSDDDDATSDDDDATSDDDDATGDDDDATGDDDDATGDDDDATAPAFPIAFTPSEYTDVLDLAVGFYGAQRCGDADNWILSSNPEGTTCHLEDGPTLASGLDLTGGWHDAGDFIKFSLTNAWSAYVLLKAAETFPSALVDTDNGVPDLLDEVKVATDYLLKTVVDADTLVARVGGDQDHDHWVTSPYQSGMSVADGGGERPVETDTQADVAGMVAGALALMASVYDSYDSVYAAECLAAARLAYTYAEANQGTTPDNYYGDTTYLDGLLCGAVELYRTTNEGPFLTAAEDWNSQLGQHWWVTDWSQNADPCRHSLALAGSSSALSTWAMDVAGYPAAVSTEPNVAGMAHFGDWGSLQYALNAAMSAALYYDHTGEEAYRDFAVSQLEYAMGINGYNRSFIVGWGANPSIRPHHKNSHGRQAMDWDLSAPHLYPLLGAMVGGPTLESADVSAPGYVDDIEDYVGNEVTIAYNAGLVATAAFVVDLLGRP